MVGDAGAADARQRLRERADNEVDIAQHALIFRASKAGSPEGAERVRFVYEDVRPMAARHLDDVAQRRYVAPDRIQTLDDDQAVPLAGRQALELLAQALG